MCVFRRGAKGPRVATSSRHRRPHVCFYNFSFFFLHQFHARESDSRKSQKNQGSTSAALHYVIRSSCCSQLASAASYVVLVFRLLPAGRGPLRVRRLVKSSKARESPVTYTHKQHTHTHTHPVVYSWYIYSTYIYTLRRLCISIV